MTGENDLIFKELVALSKRAKTAGNYDYKRLSELQTKMLQDAQAATQRSIENCDRLLEKYNLLEEHITALANGNELLSRIVMPFSQIGRGTHETEIQTTKAEDTCSIHGVPVEGNQGDKGNGNNAEKGGISYMKNKLTPKQESFCLAFMETGNASEAYRRSYNAAKMKPEVVNINAFRLTENTKIALRLAELRKPAVERAQVTLEGHLNDLKALRDAAVGEGQYSAAISAEVSRGKVSGLYVDKHELTGKDGKDLIPACELTRLERANRLATLIAVAQKRGATNGTINKTA
jgi:phage terminase small subunit